MLQPIARESKCFSYFDIRARAHTHVRMHARTDTRTHARTHACREMDELVCTCIHKHCICKCERDPICVCLPLYHSYVSAHIYFPSTRASSEREEKKIHMFAPLARSIGFVGSVFNKWLHCYRRGKTFGSRIIAATVATFSWFSSVSRSRPRVVERRKFTGYKALPSAEKVSRAQSSQTSPLSSHFPRRNVWLKENARRYMLQWNVIISSWNHYFQCGF